MSIRKYALILRVSARDQLIYLRSVIVRNLFFVLVYFIFFNLWRAVYGSGEGTTVIAGFTMAQVLWYFSFTEAVELSRSRIIDPLQTEVKDGTVAYGLGRPYSYVLFWVAKGLGESVVKVIPILVLGGLLGLAFVGPLQGYWGALPFGFLLIIGGIVLGLFIQVTIGLLAFWFEEVLPFYWITQKLVFILGGMFFPVDFFPDWLQGFSKHSPFAFVTYWPARTMVDFTPRTFAFAATGQLIYGGLLALLAFAVFRTAARRVSVQGG
jgi:ABC-2 type transport system permease protein